MNGTSRGWAAHKYTRFCTVLDGWCPSPSLISAWVVRMKGRRWIDPGGVLFIGSSPAHLMEVRRGQLVRRQGRAGTEWHYSKVGEGRDRGKEGGRTDLLLSFTLTFSRPSTDNNNLTVSPLSAPPLLCAFHKHLSSSTIVVTMYDWLAQPFGGLLSKLCLLEMTLTCYLFATDTVCYMHLLCNSHREKVVVDEWVKHRTSDQEFWCEAVWGTYLLSVLPAV